MPIGPRDELGARVVAIYETLAKLLDDPTEKLFVHHEEFGDRLLGVLAGYLIYAGLVNSGPHALSIMEKLTAKSLGAEGREIVAVTLDENLRR